MIFLIFNTPFIFQGQRAAESCHSERKTWGLLRLCLSIICICKNVDSDSDYSSCRSHYMPAEDAASIAAKTPSV
jgi:hypothetical protein